MEPITVIRALQEFGEETVPKDPAVEDVGTAAAVLDKLLAMTGVQPLFSSLRSEREAVDVGRRLLKLLVEDKDTREKISEVLADPPIDNRLAVGEIVAVAAVIGAVLGWLQTKVDLKVHRKIERPSGTDDIEFEIHKQAASNSLLTDLSRTVASLFDTKQR
ncbi:hypothetical protein AB0G05_01780 [Nonomuraea wenchangensis]